MTKLNATDPAMSELPGTRLPKYTILPSRVDIDDVHTTPRYIVEQLPTIPFDGNDECCSL